ncbi:MAG TPA: thiamine phosphate synthase [Kofleriaceae bacterium]
MSFRVLAITDRALMRDVPAALAGCPPGAVAIQVREKDLDGGALLAFARSLPGPLIINDRLDVALAAGALGVHLPERGLSVADVRRIAPGLLVGRSLHAPASSDADYVQLGPIWPTRGKPDGLGVAALTAARALLPPACRLVAVGGIDSLERAAACFAAGASAVAVVRAAWTGACPLASLARVGYQ